MSSVSDPEGSVEATKSSDPIEVQLKKKQQTSFCGFVNNNKGDTANVFCSWIVFLGYGIAMTYLVYGYDDSDDAKKNSDKCPQQYNGYSSGPYGSGAFPISLILFLVANFAYLFKMAKWMSCPDKHERKRRLEELKMVKRQSSSGVSS